MMGSVEEAEEERFRDVENTIFVAVGKDSKSTLAWAVQSFVGKKICLLHVHQPTYSVGFMDGKLSSNKLKQHAVDAFRELERQKMHKLLNQYLLILSQEGVRADKVWIEMDNIEKGIVEIIAQHNIRWLVMGAAADEYYSKKMAELKSKKAIFVCEEAPISCHIWFSCKGCLIYTRGCRKDDTEIDITPPLLLMNSDIITEQSEYFSAESVMNRQRSLNRAHAGEDANEWKGIIKGFSSQRFLHSTWPANKAVGTLKSTLLLPYEEEKNQGRESSKIYDRLEQAMIDAKNTKREAFKESVKRWKAEEDALEAICKANTSESLCAKEMSQRKEMEEALAREKQEIVRMKNQHDELTKELQMVLDHRSILESQIAESDCVMKDLDDKFFSAMGLLISFKEKRDQLRIEHQNAIKRVEQLRKFVKWEATGLGKSQFFAFTFSEINNATNNFDPSWKIGEGSKGSVYKGFLHHVHVAIKMLPSYGSQGHLEFQHEVEVLSRVRHPNLVTLIGTCPESRSLIYEYLKNGSLEDCLACRKKTTPLSWQTRIQIATEICSALIFLHSNKPCIVHGNLKPTKVLLDANFVSKLGDLGISRLIPQDKNPTNATTLYNKTNLKVSSVYMDPEFLKTGELTPKSDVYSFGIILLRLLTGRPVLGIVKDVKCALEKGNFNSVLDILAGDWPLEQAKQLAHLALWCCEENPFKRPDLVSVVWSVLEPTKTPCIASASCMNSKEHRRTPSHFVCPILQEVMKDPHIAADGFTYEAEAIQGWLNSGHNTSPMTNLKLAHCDLIPNYALHYAIQEWQQQS